MSTIKGEARRGGSSVAVNHAGGKELGYSMINGGSCTWELLHSQPISGIPSAAILSKLWDLFVSYSRIWNGNMDSLGNYNLLSHDLTQFI